MEDDENDDENRLATALLDLIQRDELANKTFMSGGMEMFSESPSANKTDADMSPHLPIAFTHICPNCLVVREHAWVDARKYCPCCLELPSLH